MSQWCLDTVPAQGSYCTTCSSVEEMEQDTHKALNVMPWELKGKDITDHFCISANTPLGLEPEETAETEPVPEVAIFEI